MYKIKNLYDNITVKCLTTLNEAKRLIKKNHGIDIDYYNLRMDDEEAYRVMWEGQNFGIFQFEASGISSFVNACQPKNIHDVAMITASYRPKMDWGFR